MNRNLNKKNMLKKKKGRRNTQASRREQMTKIQGSTFDKDIVSNNHPSLKWVETQVVGTISSSGGASVINWPSNGTGFNSRVGNAINLKRVDLSGSLSLSTVGVNNFRLMLVQQVGPLFATSWSDILIPTSVGIVPESQMIPGVTSQFNILYDECFDLNSAGSNGIVTFYRKINLRQKRVFFEGNSNVVYSGSLILLYLAGPGTVLVDLNSQSFLFFAD